MTVAEQELDRLLAQMARTKINRRGFLAASGLGASAAFLAACSGSSSSAAPGGSGAAAPGASYATEGALFMYNWSDYVDVDNMEEFKARYGIDPFTYDIYSSNEELLTKLQGGAVGLYDVGVLVHVLLLGGLMLLLLGALKARDAATASGRRAPGPADRP